MDTYLQGDRCVRAWHDSCILNGQIDPLREEIMKKLIAITLFTFVAMMNFASGYEVSSDQSQGIVCDCRSESNDKIDQDFSADDVKKLIQISSTSI